MFVASSTKYFHLEASSSFSESVEVRRYPLRACFFSLLLLVNLSSLPLFFSRIEGVRLQLDTKLGNIYTHNDYNSVYLP